MSSTDNSDVAGLMGPELAANVSFLGQYVRSAQVVMITEMAVYGAYCVLVAMALYAVGIRPERTYRIFWLLSALLFTFALVTISIVIDVAGPVKFVETVFIGTSGSPSFTTRIGEYVGWTESKHLTLVFLWINGTADTGLLFIINDILASWRAISIWGMKRSSTRVYAVVLYFFVFTSFAFWAAFVGLFTYRSQNGFSTLLEGTDTANVLLYISSAASIVANLLATGLIAYATFEHVKTVSVTGNRTRSSRILVFLTESGVLYAVIQIIRLGLSASVTTATTPYSPLFMASLVFSNATSIVTAMYPPALLLIIRYGYSLADTMVCSTANSPRSGSDRGRNVEETVSTIKFKRPSALNDSTGATTSERTRTGGSDADLKA